MANSTTKSTRIVCISDTHSKYDFDLPDGDILIHAGDITRRGGYEEIKQFLLWFKSLTKFRLKIFIAGNHDVTLDKSFYENNWEKFHSKKENQEEILNIINDLTLQDNYGIIYLQDQLFIDPISQLKFYGSPWQPAYGTWAFNIDSDSEEMHAIWNKIPSETDILITHGPPYEILDFTFRKEHAGCKVLYERVKIIQPKLHVFGHIHEGYGKKIDENIKSTIFVNAATCNIFYRPLQPPIVVEI